MNSAELFAGCGGLALGMSRAGFKHLTMVEWDADAVATVTFNVQRRVEHVVDWPMRRLDVRDVDWRPYKGSLDVISGGPPCQPFGIGGKKRGSKDHRDMWPEAVRAVAEACPSAFLFENVRNLASPTFRPYLHWIVGCLRRPNVKRLDGESHTDHLARMESSRGAPDYDVIWQIVNAADFGAPQIRYRIIIQGLAAHLGALAKPLVPTHSRERLLWDQYVTGDYWRRHGMRMPGEPEDSDDAARVRLLLKGNVPPAGKAWLTLRDAIAGLGEPNGRNCHIFQPGARSYAGHTGSLLDQPAKALKAGDHGVPGGENMIRFADSSIRYFSMREAARLVGLPDNYAFPRSWTETMRQLGNAVPTALAEAAGLHMRTQVDAAKSCSTIRAAAA